MISENTLQDTLTLSQGSLKLPANKGINFGHQIKKKHFLLGENFINLNHGSFGAVPKEGKLQFTYILIYINLLSAFFILFYNYTKLLYSSK